MANKPNILYFTSSLAGCESADGESARDRTVAALLKCLGAAATVRYSHTAGHLESLPAAAGLWRDMNTPRLLAARRKSAAEWFAATGIVIDGCLSEQRQQQILQHADQSRMPVLIVGKSEVPGIDRPGSIWQVALNLSPQQTTAIFADFVQANPTLVPIYSEENDEKPASDCRRRL